MLKVLRDSMKYLAWVLWAVIAVFVLFVFVDFGSVMPTGGPSQSAASVGEENVTYREFQRAYQNLEQQMRDTFGDQYNADLAKQLQLPRQALDRVVNQKILLQEAERMEIDVTDEQLRRYILAMPVFSDENGFVGAERYDNIVRRLGYNPDTFEDSIRQELLVQRVLTSLERAMVVSDAGVEQAFRDETERATVRFALVPASRLAPNVEVPDDAVRAYYDENPDEFEREEQRSGQYVIVDATAAAATDDVSDEEKRAYYDENLAEFAEQERVRARHILIHAEDMGDEEARARVDEARRRIESGEEFTDVAKEMSDEPGADQRGGDLGWFGRGRMVKPFEDAAFAATPGELVGPVITQFGYHLIEVLERQEERQRTYEEVESTIAQRLSAELGGERAEEAARALFDELSGAGDVTRETLEAAATEREGIEFGETRAFERFGAVQPIGNAPNLAQAAFDLEVGELSQPVRTPRGWVLFRLDEVVEPHVPPLDEIRPQIERAVRRELQVEAGLAAATDQLVGLDSVDAWADLNGVEARDTQEFGRESFIPGLGVHREINEAAFSLDEGVIGGPFVHNQNIAVVQVASRQEFDPVAFDAEKERVRLELERQELNSILGSLIAKRRRELDVRYDAQLLQSFELADGDGQAS